MGAQDLKLSQRAETHEGVIFKQVPLRMCGPKRAAMGFAAAIGYRAAATAQAAVDACHDATAG